MDAMFLALLAGLAVLSGWLITACSRLEGK